jgi:hypothetical protein
MKISSLKFNKDKKKAGYSLIFAVLISGTLITIGAAMANLALKEFTIVGTTRASQTAFYAADAGMECALYYDVQGGPHFQEPFNYNAAAYNINCNNANIAVTTSGVSVNGVTDQRVTNTFQFTYNGSCVNVRVTKIDWGDGVDGWDGSSYSLSEPDGYNGPGIGTIIESRATNVACSGSKAPVQVERALRVDY